MNLQIYEEASDWIIKNRSGVPDAGERRAFDSWLRESPQHVEAYLEMSTVWEDVPALDPSWNVSSEELIARARADANIVPLTIACESTVAPTQVRDQSNAPRTRRVRALGAIAATILGSLTIGWFYLQRGVYATEVGEQRSLALADGSTVELNSRSRIRVFYRENERRIDLLEGQALFRVAQNRNRPFIVQTGSTRVRAIGTAFDVYQMSSGAVVTVVEGKVAVQSARRPESDVHGRIASSKHEALRQSSADEILVSAGEQIIVSPAAVSSPQRTNIASAMAWTRRSLVFESSPLTKVAREFNRYNNRRLVIDDPRLEDFHVSGVFSSAEPTLLLRFLRAQPELIVQETESEFRVAKR